MVGGETEKVEMTALLEYFEIFMVKFMKFTPNIQSMKKFSFILFFILYRLYSVPVCSNMYCSFRLPNLNTMYMD